MSGPGDSVFDPLIGQVVDGRYHIRRVLGHGGMGVVYEAEATRLGRRRCAVKVLRPEFTSSETAVARFSREAELAARVKHPNVVEIFDTGTTAEGQGYIAMELLHGESLDRTLRREGPMPWSRAQHIMLQICRALAVAHAAKIVHRDMKPENCFRGERDDDPDYIKVLDFGIAKLPDDEQSDDVPRLTATNAVIGTYAYMASEQVRGEEIDHRVDVWALGVMLYEMLTGRIPFRGNNQGQIWTAICNYDPEPMRNIAPGAAIPEPAEAIVRQALARVRDERYPTVEALARAIASVQADGSIRSVTAKISIPTFPPVVATSAAFAHGRTAAMEPRASRTDPISVHGLTELSADEVDDTGEHTRTVLRTTPGPNSGSTSLAPPREAMATQNADQRMDPGPALVAPSLPATRNSRRAVWPLVGLGLSSVVLVVWLSQGTIETRVSKSDASTVPDLPVKDAAPIPIPLDPEVEVARKTSVDPTSETLSVTSTGSSEPELDQTSDHELPDAPTNPTTNNPSASESFHTKVANEIKRFRSNTEVKDCFRTYQPGGSLKVWITVSVAGAPTMTFQPIQKGTFLADCLDGALKKRRFDAGKQGDIAFRRDYTLPAK